MRTYGAEGAYQLNPHWSLAGEAWHEDNLETTPSVTWKASRLSTGRNVTA